MSLQGPGEPARQARGRSGAETPSAGANDSVLMNALACVLYLPLIFQPHEVFIKERFICLHIVCVPVCLSVYVCMPHVCRYLQKPEKGILRMRSPGAATVSYTTEQFVLCHLM